MWIKINHNKRYLHCGRIGSHSHQYPHFAQTSVTSSMLRCLNLHLPCAARWELCRPRDLLAGDSSCVQRHRVGCGHARSQNQPTHRQTSFPEVSGSNCLTGHFYGLPGCPLQRFCLCFWEMVRAASFSVSMRGQRLLRAPPPVSPLVCLGGDWPSDSQLATGSAACRHRCALDLEVYCFSFYNQITLLIVQAI